ncbi:ribosome biogenesis GTPase Der [Corynebacterium lizhenjunii]|uniref:GTPase Der n=1 Tax=Corynebacterium lizhenjunii TaxID=2709394 RepID=A0A7T0KGK2_9CORY|nr:ribosome biogenesis GTPase Der [Corynebacterium lizhenjunii]QPK80152.1 ribosome biogenesis GTPase Der [Corynebacterium lizhenjunii]
MSNSPTGSSGHEQEPETVFHYPHGKLEEEEVRAPHDGWADADFEEADFGDFDFDEAEFDSAGFDDSEFGKPEFGDAEYAIGAINEEALTEEQWAEIERAYGVNADGHIEENLCTVAVVGRPNVGKSSLVNRFLGRREAVVEDHPGVTRDRISYVAEWNGQRFLVQDTGGWDPNVKGIHAAIARQAEVAMSTADVIVFVVDTKVGITETDSVMARKLQKSDVPVVLVSNKFDSDNMYADMAEFYALGLGDPWPVSAQHGRGGADVLDEVLRLFPDQPRAASITSGPRRVALVGKPNVGKSSLLNKFTGEERSVVDNVAGTTVDPVDSLVQLDQQLWKFIDTAGLRKKVKNAQGHEYYASLRTRGVIDAAEVCVMLIDASQEISEQDQRVLNMVLEAGKALVIAFNKWDLMSEDRRYFLDREIEQQLAHLPWVSRINISAQTGRALQKLEPAMLEALDSWDQRVSTGQLNTWLREAIAANPPPMKNNRLPRVLFATQASTQPPTIVLFTTGFLDAGYRRYLERKFRERFGFHGSPVRIAVRVRERRTKKR